MLKENKNEKEIDDIIRNLNYNPNEVMAFSGNKITSFMPKEGKVSNDKYIVVTKKKHTMSGDYEITVSNSNLSTTYPGALILANQDVVEGFPTPLSTDRAPIVVSIDLPALKEDNHYTVGEPNYANVSNAITRLLERWYSLEGEYKIPAKIQYKSSILFDAKAMALKFGCDVEYMQQKLGIDFDLIQNQNHSAYLMEFKQIFYTVSVEPPRNPSSVFGGTVTGEELSKKINEKNPPAYIQNVQYGREIFLLIESDLDSQTLNTVMEGHFTFNNGKLDVKGDLDYKTLSKQLKCTLYLLGGNPANIKFDKNLVDQMNQLITDNVELTKENPGTPLSYTVAFLKDNKICNVYGKTEYITTHSEIYSAGKIKLAHWGAYIARFTVEWDLIKNYDEKGNEILEHQCWSDNGKHKTAGFQTIISLTANAKNIKVKAEGSTGLVWDRWHTPVNTPPMPLIPQRTITIDGTTLYQTGEVDPEP